MRPFFRKLKRLYEFIPVIWNSYDYDYRSAIDIFTYQLQRTVSELRTSKWQHTTSEYDARRIELVLRLLDYSYNGKGEESVLENYEFRYGKLNFSFEKWEDDDKYSVLTTKWTHAVNDSHNDEIDTMYRDDLQKIRQRQKRAKDLAWKIIAKDIEKWWI